MKQLILFIVLICQFSCKSDSEKMTESTNNFLDSLKISELAKERTDSLIKNVRKNNYLDTTGVNNSPVKVTTSRLIKKEYSNYRDIKLTFKNVSKKNIQAIKFEWYGENAFNKPADMGNYSLPGEGGGFTDDLLKAGKSTTSTWSISSRDAKKIITARAYEVAFTDGTNWQLRKE